MRNLFISLALIAMASSAFAVQATAPTFSLPTGSYSGVQLNWITDANGGVKIACGTIGPLNGAATPHTSGNGFSCQNDGNSFALNSPVAFTIGTTEQLCVVVGTSTLTDSTPTCANYTLTNTSLIAPDVAGFQCQDNALNCPSKFIAANAPGRLRIWDAASPFFSVNAAGTNCNWSSIESQTAGVYAWGCLEAWMDAIDAYRNGTSPYSSPHPSFTAAYTFGMVPCVQVTLPGPFSITGVTAANNTGNAQTSTTTYSGSFGSVNLFGIYVTVSGMSVAGNNITLTPSTGTGKAIITNWTAGSITVTGQAGVAPDLTDPGTLQGVPGPKGCGIVPSDLPLSAGVAWTGTPPSPGGSPSFNNFVTALVNHCSVANPTHCFYNEFNAVEMWNEPNNNIFCNPGFCSIAQVLQMMFGAAPIIAAKMNGTGGANQVLFQSIASTASAAATNTVLSIESANGIRSNIVAFHQYWGPTSSGLPEDQIGVSLSIAAKRALNLGFPAHPVRITEWGYQSNNAPYGCTSPWTLTDCYNQPVRWLVLLLSNGFQGADAYNWGINCLNVPACAAIFSQAQSYLVGGKFSSACTTASNIYQCSFSEAGGITALFVWRKCVNDGTYANCSANGDHFIVPGGGYNNYRDMAGISHATTTGASIPISVSPIMLEQLGSPPAAPSKLGAFISELIYGLRAR